MEYDDTDRYIIKNYYDTDNMSSNLTNRPSDMVQNQLSFAEDQLGTKESQRYSSPYISANLTPAESHRQHINTYNGSELYQLDQSLENGHFKDIETMRSKKLPLNPANSEAKYINNQFNSGVKIRDLTPRGGSDESDIQFNTIGYTNSEAYNKNESEQNFARLSNLGPPIIINQDTNRENFMNNTIDEESLEESKEDHYVSVLSNYTVHENYNLNCNNKKDMQEQDENYQKEMLKFVRNTNEVIIGSHPLDLRPSFLNSEEDRSNTRQTVTNYWDRFSEIELLQNETKLKNQLVVTQVNQTSLQPEPYQKSTIKLIPVVDRTSFDYWGTFNQGHNIEESVQIEDVISKEDNSDVNFKKNKVIDKMKGADGVILNEKNVLLTRELRLRNKTPRGQLNHKVDVEDHLNLIIGSIRQSYDALDFTSSHQEIQTNLIKIREIEEIQRQSAAKIRQETESQPDQDTVAQSDYITLEEEIEILLSLQRKERQRYKVYLDDSQEADEDYDVKTLHGFDGKSSELAVIEGEADSERELVKRINDISVCDTPKRRVGLELG